ncbi:MAG: urease accessory protein UreE, partial [Alistipes sp.]|nr:urease accessory protein UreE [Alistipes sp.]
MVYTEILGNIAEPEWAERYATCSVEHIALDQWAAQKSRLKAVGDRGNEYAIALKRHATLRDGDVVSYNAEEQQMVVIRLRLNDI